MPIIIMLLDPNSWLVISKTLYGSRPFLFKLSKALFMHSQSEHGTAALEDHTEGPEIVHFILGKVCMCKDEAFCIFGKPSATSEIDMCLTKKPSKFLKKKSSNFCCMKEHFK